MTRQVQIVLLCEDNQHEAFARRFLKKAGWEARHLRVEKASQGKGAATQFVCERFPSELKEYRSRCAHIDLRLVVLVDGDQRGVAGRQQDLDQACMKASVPLRQPGEKVAIFVPTWNIETWLAYLDGKAVSEQESNYPRLKQERDCKRHVDALWAMCQKGTLQPPAPPSLQAACQEYALRVR